MNYADKRELLILRLVEIASISKKFRDIILSFPRPVGHNIYISIVTWHHLVSGKLTLEADLRGNERSTGKNMKMPVNSKTCYFDPLTHLF